jgi:uncharacterized protein (TIGR02001 family)
MQKKLLVAVLGTLFAMPVFAEEAPAAAAPALTSNVALVSNYLYRGITQSGAKPAIQGGIDYAHASGLYVGAWGSSISWLSDESIASNAGLELDTYAGYKNSFATDYSYDIGFLRYNYPGSYGANTKADTNEIYGLIGWKWLSAKYSYSLGDTFGVANAKGTDYVDFSANYPVADTGYTLGAHYGKQTFKGAANGGLSYNDYKLSVTKDISGYVLGLAYSNTNAKVIPYTYTGKFFGKSTAVLSASRTF